MSKKGALPFQTIVQMLGSNIFDAKKENVRPSSIDLTISSEAYRLEGGIFLPSHDEKVVDVLSKIPKKKIEFTEGKINIEKDISYLIKINESLSLPSSVYGTANPKSSSGRLDIHVRLLADGITRYDTVYNGYAGSLWLLVTSKTFNCVLEEGMSLNQIRFFNADTRLDETELEILLQKTGLVFKKDDSKIYYSHLRVSDHDGSIILTLDIENDVFGYQAIQTTKPIDLSKRDYDWRLFFNRLEKQNGCLTLKKGEFYILVCKEKIKVPPDLACEMVPMDERTGEFRSHYAGFIDPGWGYGKEGELNGRPLVMEVRPFEDVLVRHSHPIAKIRFERLTCEPDIVYDETDSNYSQQTGPKLAKQFKSV